MTKEGKRFWTWCYMIASFAVIGAHMSGCVEVGGSSSDVCSGTECGTHDESDNSTDNSDNSTS